MNGPDVAEALNAFARCVDPSRVTVGFNELMVESGPFSIGLDRGAEGWVARLRVACAAPREGRFIGVVGESRGSSAAAALAGMKGELDGLVALVTDGVTPVQVVWRGVTP